MERFGNASYLTLLSEPAASVHTADLASTLVGQEEEDADEDNVQFLRSTLAQLDELESRSTERRPDLSDGASPSSNITPSERDTVRRLRRYVLQGGRATPTPQRESDHRPQAALARDTNRHVEYQGWAPGSTDHENAEPLMTFSDLRTLARGHSRGESDNPTRRHYREQATRALSNMNGRRQTPEQEMDWEPTRFLFTDADNSTGDSSLRTTALLQSVRRHARFSPRPTTSSDDQFLAWAVRDRAHALRRMRSASSRDPHAEPPIRSHRARTDGESSVVASRWLEEAIKYLERLRSCQSMMERQQSAAAGGFVSGEFFLGQPKTDDFIMDTTHIPPPPRSSWLRTGSVFSGFQKSTSSINISLASVPPPSSRRAAAHGNPSDRAPSSSLDAARGSWINRVIARTASDGAPHAESWPVKVTITSVDYDAMTLTGTMEAFNVPNKACPAQQSTIATYLEGELIDFNRYTLETTSFNAKSSVDSTYWRELEPFQSLPDHALVQSLLSATWLKEELEQKYILMRWKGLLSSGAPEALLHLRSC